MSWTLLTSGSAIAKAGAGADSTIIASGSTLQRWADEAENDACTIARYDVVSNYTNLTDNGKRVFEKFCSAQVAQNIINYQMGGYSSRQEAVMMLNVLENQKGETRKLILDDKNKTYLGIAS